MISTFFLFISTRSVAVNVITHCRSVILLQVCHSSDSEVNVCSELDWKRCLAVHLWFMLPPTASVADALTRYEAAFKVSLARWTRLFPANLATFLHFSLFSCPFRVQMRKASMPVPPCLPIWKRNTPTLRKRRKKSVSGRCTTSAFTCSSSTVTGEFPPVFK